MASLGPQVWKPQVILLFFLLLLVLDCCWLREGLATDFLWWWWVAVMTTHFTPDSKSRSYCETEYYYPDWIQDGSLAVTGSRSPGVRSIPAPTIRVSVTTRGWGAATSQWEAWASEMRSAECQERRRKAQTYKRKEATSNYFNQIVKCAILFGYV